MVRYKNAMGSIDTETYKIVCKHETRVALITIVSWRRSEQQDIWIKLNVYVHTGFDIYSFARMEKNVFPKSCLKTIKNPSDPLYTTGFSNAVCRVFWPRHHMVENNIIVFMISSGCICDAFCGGFHRYFPWKILPQLSLRFAKCSFMCWSCSAFFPLLYYAFKKYIVLIIYLFVFLLRGFWKQIIKILVATAIFAMPLVPFLHLTHV